MPSSKLFRFILSYKHSVLIQLIAEWFEHRQKVKSARGGESIAEEMEADSDADSQIPNCGCRG